jgi:bacteriocin biosynthesis cyclodehydratase domain-containing protein
MQDCVQFRSPLRTLTLRSQGGTQRLLQVLNLLDGQRTISEIATALPDQEEAQVAQIIRQLHNAGLLEEGSEQVAEQFEHQRILFSSLSPDQSGRSMQERLERARLVMIGVGAVGAAALSCLAAAGVSYVRLVDPGQVVPADVGLLFGPADVGGERVTVAAHRLKALYGSMEIQASTQSFESAEDCVRVLDDNVDLLLLCQDDVRPLLNDWINTACLETGTTWLPAWLEGPVGYIGPTVVPYQTPCFICYQIRKQETLDDYDEFMAFDNHLRSGRDERVTYGSTAALAGSVGSLSAWEAICVLTRVTRAASYSRLLKVNLLESRTTVHPVWKYPHCPACGRQGRFPAAYAWDEVLGDRV